MTAEPGSNGPQHGQSHLWNPPVRAAKLTAGACKCYKWNIGIGRLASINVDIGQLREYKTASIFSPEDGGRLVAVRFDATKRDVSSSTEGWHVIGFHHERAPHSTVYSKIDFVGAELHVAARQPAHISPQLVPCPYQPQASSRINGGIIGLLPILIGLACFSTQRPFSAVEGGIRSRRWVPQQGPSGNRKPPRHEPDKSFGLKQLH